MIATGFRAARYWYAGHSGVDRHLHGTSAWLPGVCCSLLLLWPIGSSTPPGSSTFVQPLRVTRGNATRTASCTLIARDERSDGVDLYFITAAHLFGASWDDRTMALSAVAIGAADRRIDIRPADVILPTGPLVDLALLRATVVGTDLLPQPLEFTPPPTGEPFIVSAVAEDGRRIDLQQHVFFTSTLYVMGDRDASHLAGCIGAAASATAATFGIVTSCETRKAPLVTLLGPAREFLNRHIRTMRTGRITS